MRFSTTGMLVTPLLARRPCPYSVLGSLYSSPWDFFSFCFPLRVSASAVLLSPPLHSLGYLQQLVSSQHLLERYIIKTSPSSVTASHLPVLCLLVSGLCPVFVLRAQLCLGHSVQGLGGILEGKVYIFYISLPAGPINTAFPNTCPSPCRPHVDTWD